MERVDMPNDDFREKLTVADIERVCRAHNLPTPKTIASERRGNDKVAYHDVGGIYVSMLALDRKYYEAFRKGYDRVNSKSACLYPWYRV